MSDNIAELVLRRSSKMTLSLAVPTAVLPQFFIGATIKIHGQPCLIEEMKAEQSNIAVGEVPVTLTVLVL